MLVVPPKEVCGTYAVAASQVKSSPPQPLIRKPCPDRRLSPPKQLPSLSFRIEMFEPGRLSPIIIIGPFTKETFVRMPSFSGGVRMLKISPTDSGISNF